MKFKIIFANESGQPIGEAHIECDNSTAAFAAACIQVKEQHDNIMKEHNSTHGPLHALINSLKKGMKPEEC